MNHDIIIKCIIETLLFLEFSDPMLLDEDHAVNFMEHFAAILSTLNHNDKNILIQSIKSIAKDYPPEQRRFIQSIPESLGIIG